MRARYTRSIGLPVHDEETGEILGGISGILLNPDTGVVEGFFVRTPGFLSHTDLFLPGLSILHWGIRVTVRDHHALSPVEDLIRLAPLLAEQRTILGQRIVTEGGRGLGRCTDIQFSTKDFRLEWLFPRRLLRAGPPIPASQILEVRPDAIVLRESAVPEKVESPADPISIIPAVPEAA